jgi:hypothetical protein
MKAGSQGWFLVFALASALGIACGSEDEGKDTSPATSGDAGATPQANAGAGGAASGTTAGTSTGQAGGGLPSGAATAGGSGAADAGAATQGGTATVRDAGGGAVPGGSGADGGTPGGSTPPAPLTGDKNGDPAKPVVMAEGVACRAAGGAGGGAAAGLGSPNAKVGDRDLIVDYPCGKHEGAHMTVILNLHGTLIMGAPWQYQRGYFSAYRFVDSHNLIVVQPHSVSTASAGAQWGNMDNGMDEPHLLAVVDWVWKTFSKYQLTGLWVGGHSWGAAYATGGRVGKGFVCHDAFKDKARGAIGMSGAGIPPCIDRVSLISTRGGMENIALLDQTAAAMKHGCMTPIKGPDAVGNNERRWFDCGGKWVHDDYLMTGKAHTDFMDQEVVKKIVETIKATEE